MYVCMSDPSNTPHGTSHFSNPSAAMGPYVSQTNGMKTCALRMFSASANGRRSVCLRNAAETQGPTAADEFEKCEVRCGVLIGALIYIYIFLKNI